MHHVYKFGGEKKMQNVDEFGGEKGAQCLWMWLWSIYLSKSTEMDYERPQVMNKSVMILVLKKTRALPTISFSNLSQSSVYYFHCLPWSCDLVGCCNLIWPTYTYLSWHCQAHSESRYKKGVSFDLLWGSNSSPFLQLNALLTSLLTCFNLENAIKPDPIRFYC